MMHSQLNEEEVILMYFGPSFRGTFLDVGANDGKTFSNTHALALAGWSGTCVDASPVAFASLSRTYADNPAVQCIEAAVTTKDGPITLHQASDTLVSSLNADQPDQWRAYNFTWEAVSVRGVTFQSLLDLSTIKRFDFVSIDVEGHDLSIIEQMDMDALGVRLICVEHGDRINTIKAALPMFKEVSRNGINIIMGR